MIISRRMLGKALLSLPASSKVHGRPLKPQLNTRDAVRTAMYVGNDPAALVAAEAWLNCNLDSVQVFIGHASWADWLGSMPWLAELFRSTDRKILWSVPLIPVGASLDGASAGAYDDQYRIMAENLAREGNQSEEIYVRIGWEFNGDWFPWSAIARPDTYVSAFRRLTGIFRSVSNMFVFEWTPNIGGALMDPECAYPGDEYVDVIGADFYYDIAFEPRDAQLAWVNFRDQRFGLQWHQDHAARHRKPTAISEWGLNIDSPIFIQLAQHWFKVNRVLYHSYWNSNGAFRGKLSDGQYPSAAAAFKRAFGASDNKSETGGKQ